MKFKVGVTVTVEGLKVEADTPDEALARAVADVEKLVGQEVMLNYYDVVSDGDVSDPDGPRSNKFIGQFSL